MLRFGLGWVGPALVLCALSLACGPAATPATPTPAADAFAVVRATSQAAFQAGQRELASGDYLKACVDLDTARTNDPDNRPEIQQALDQALATGCPQPAQLTSAQVPAQQRTIVVATIAAGVGSAINGTATPGPVDAASTLTSVATPPGTSNGGTPQTTASATVNLAGGAPVTAQAAVATPTAAQVTGAATATPNPTAAASTALVAWQDPQGRFAISAPPDWTKSNQPQSLVGTPVVGFGDPSGQAEVNVSVDTNARAVSPELYAANLELAMQQQVAGYASEQVLPGTTAGSPSVRRVFTFTQKDPAGQSHQARGFQVTIVKGSTPYIISGSAPAEQYQQYSATFDSIVESFRFS